VPGSSHQIKLYRIAGPVRHAGVTAEASYAIVEPPPILLTSRAAAQQLAQLPEGMVLAGRYEIVQLLGEGGMGTVYRARDLKLGSDVALKLLKHELSGDESRRSRLYREVRLAQLVSHPNVARIYDLQAWDGFEFISMEYIRGKTLAERLIVDGAFSVAEGLDVLRQMCAGLAAAHAANIIHRDLKPPNIMLKEGGRVVIMDFGVACWGSAMQKTGSEIRGVVGSPYYMAPEQFEDAKVDQRADIYALGVVAFEMFTGKKPFEADTALALAYKHSRKPPPDPLGIRPELPLRLVAVILRCLEKSPSTRFGSVGEIASLLTVTAPLHQAATVQLPLEIKIPPRTRPGDSSESSTDSQT
jgi:serine/threonine-protein kinase